jgi:hypothetical protein
MKRLLLVCAIFALSGCAVFDAYFMAKYDTNEYALINDIKTKAQVAEDNCSNNLLVTIQVNEIYIKSLEFKNFATHIPRNEDSIKLSDKLLILTKDSKEQFNKSAVSTFYCKAKLEQIVKSADTIQQAIGRKPR